MTSIRKRMTKVLSNFCYFLAILILLTTIVYSAVAIYKGVGGWRTDAIISLVLSGVLTFLGWFYE